MRARTQKVPGVEGSGGDAYLQKRNSRTPKSRKRIREERKSSGERIWGVKSNAAALKKKKIFLKGHENQWTGRQSHCLQGDNRER